MFSTCSILSCHRHVTGLSAWLQLCIASTDEAVRDFVCQTHLVHFFQWSLAWFLVKKLLKYACWKCKPTAIANNYVLIFENKKPAFIYSFFPFDWKWLSLFYLDLISLSESGFRCINVHCMINGNEHYRSVSNKHAWQSLNQTENGFSIFWLSNLVHMWQMLHSF